MKSKYYRMLFVSLLAVGFAGVTTAQFDDIYFDPENADEAYAAVELEKYYDNDKGESKSVEDDYDYYYSSRIKRFDRSYYGFDFYSPVYVDPFYYNPAYAGFYRPGSSIYWAGSPYPASPYTGNAIYVSSGFGYAYGYNSPFAPAYTYPVSYGGGFYGSAGFPSYNGVYGGSYGGIGGGYGGGYNAYCPPTVGSIYSNPNGGIFRPGNTGGSSVNVPGPRGTTTTSGGTVYGPRGGSGAVTSSPRSINNGNNGGVSAPDRPLVGGSTVQSPRSGQRSTVSSPREVSYNAPRSERPSYTPPASVNNRPGTFSNTTRSSAGSSANRYQSTRPSRSSYSRPSSSSSSWQTSNPSSRSSFSSPRSSSSSSRSSFSSPRSSSSSSRSSGGSSPRSSGGRGGK